MPRYFTLEEAQRLLPDVERTLREALTLKPLYEGADAELRAVNERIMALGGSLVDPQKVKGQRSRRDALAQRLKEYIQEIHEYGCLVKDLEMGLIDFPTLLRGSEVYMCWKMGEQDIAFWHSVDEGFRGRKPIDEEFIRNHRGGEE